MLSKIGSDGRSFYKLMEYPDFLLALLYSVTFFCLIASLVKQLKFRKHLLWLSYFPLLAGFSDWSENIISLSMIKHFPNIAEWATTAGRTATMCKWSFIAVSLCITVCLLCWLIVHQLHQQMSKKNRS